MGFCAVCNGFLPNCDTVYGVFFDLVSIPITTNDSLAKIELC